METRIKYIPLGLFCIYAFKTLASGALLVDAPIFLILASLAAIYEIKSQTKAMLNLEKKLEDLHKNHASLEKEMAEVKNHINGLKLGSNIRTVSLGNK